MIRSLSCWAMSLTISDWFTWKQHFSFKKRQSPPFSFPVSRSAAAAKSLQSCPTLCDPRDGSLPGSPIPGILQARTLEWVAISFSNAWKWKVKVKSLSRVWLVVTPWTAAYQAPPSMGFSRQEYWSGVSLPSPVSRSSCFLFCKTPSARKSSWSCNKKHSNDSD